MKTAGKTAALVGAVLLLALVIVTSFRVFRHVQEAAEARKHTNEAISRASDLLSAVKDAETGQRGYCLTGDEAFLKPYLAVCGQVKADLGGLRRLTLLPAAVRHLDAAAPLLDAKVAEMAQVIELRRDRDVAAAVAAVAGGQGMRLMDALRAEVAAFTKIEEAARAEHEAELQASMRRLFAIIVGASLAMLLLALAFAYLIHRETRHQIEARVHLETRLLLENQEESNRQLRQVNTTLQISEERFSVTIESIGDAVIATDASGRVTLLNPVAARLTGWTQADAASRPVAEIFHVIDRETRQPSLVPLNEALAKGTQQRLAAQTILISREGGECAVDDSCAPIRDRDGHIVGAVMVFRDVDREYAAQQALQDSGEVIQTILSTVADGIITVHASSGVLQTVNPAAERMFGWDAGELTGRSVTLAIPSLERDERDQLVAQGDRPDGAPPLAPTREVVGRRRDGSAFPLEIAFSEMFLGGQRYFTGILRDLTSRRRAEDALLQAGALQKAIFNSANFSSIATDAKGVIQIFNVGAERMLGYVAADVVNKVTPANISDPVEVIARAKSLSAELERPIAPGFEALVFKASRGIEDIYELTYIRKDGSRLPAIVSVTALRDERNEIIGYLLIGTDNSARRQAEEALQKAGALQKAIFNSANFSSIATDAKGVIQIFNVGAERMLGYVAADVLNKITPADISDPVELIARARTLSAELESPIAPGFEALVFKASRGIEDIYELTYIRKDGSRLPAIVSVTALRDERNEIIGYLLIGTDNSARRQAEEALQKAGALQKAIFNSANFSSIATDAKGVIQIFNVGAERMLGYVAVDVVNKITPADISDPVEVIARARSLSAELERPIAPGFEALVFKASRGIEDIYELTYIRKDGSRLPAIVSVTALRDERNEIIGYLLIGTDNSARRQAEDALEKAGTLQKAIFNSANFSSIATDDRGVIQIFNVGAERMLGYAASDVLNKITPADISDPEEVIRRAKTLSRELATPISPGFEALVFKASRGIEDIYELTYLRKDGSRLPAIVSVTALRDARGSIIGFLLIGTDNTARKRVEEEQKQLAQRLRDSQFYTRSLFESNIDALMTTDPAGVITDVNKQMETLTACTRDELLGSPFSRHFTDAEMAEAGIHLVLGAKMISNYELTARDRNGRQTEVSVNATTFYDRDRTLQGVFAAARDITERKHLDRVLHDKNAELEIARSEAETASLAKSEFISSMSHELRSPLNAILGFAQLIESDSPPPTPGQQESVSQILRAGWHLLSLIDEILDLSKVESGQLHLSPEPVSLGEVILECRDMVAPQVSQRGIRMTVPEAAARQWVSADRTRLKQVVLNLLSNAIKYNGKEGQIEVKCQEALPGRVRVSIRDTGAGLRPEEIPQLFQAFNRLGQEGGSEEGTGIGLVVAKRLVQLMGGTMGVDSTVGVGSVFWFELATAGEPRLAADGGEVKEVERAALPGDPRGHTLLYVEDNPANLRLMEQIIGRCPDIRLLTASNGNTGVEIARSSRPDVILMDINLPGISGFDALKLLRADRATAHIPVVALTANALPRDRARGLKAGFFTYMTKPIKVKEFLQVLDGALAFAGEEAAKRK